MLDSTVIRLPSELHSIWPGVRTNQGDLTAALKVQVRLDYRRGCIDHVGFQSGRQQDRAAPALQAPLPVGSIRLADSGYFSLPVLRQYDDAGVYFLTRATINTRLSTTTGETVSLAAFVTRFAQDGRVDEPIYLGKKEQLPCRLIAWRVSAKSAQRRRRKLKIQSRKQQRPINPDAWALAGWAVFVTNVPPSLLSLEEIAILSKVRWQIELLFKLWKSHAHLARSRSQNPWRILWTSMPGVTVTLLDSTGTVVATTVSDAQGGFSFVVVPGTYVVQFPTTGLTLSGQGDDSTLNSDADQGTGQATVTVGSGETHNTLGAGYLPANLGGFVWDDLNTNGLQEAGEPGVLSVQVTLRRPDENGACLLGGVVVDTTFTDADGVYRFDSLLPGEYCLDFGRPDHYEFTLFKQGGDSSLNSDADQATGLTDVIVLDSGQTDLTWDAGLVQTETPLPLASLGNYVWLDLDRNGLQGVGEPGIAGVTVLLFQANENGEPVQVGSTVTDGNGGYLFDHLLAGTYFIEIAPSSGFGFSKALVGADNTIDSNAHAPTISLHIEQQAQAAVRGAPIAYTIVHSNLSDLDAIGVVLSTTVPFGTEIDLEASNGWVCEDGEVSAGTVCRLQAGDLPANDSGTAALTLRILPGVSDSPSSVSLIAIVEHNTPGHTDQIILPENSQNLTLDAAIVPLSGGVSEAGIISAVVDVPTAVEPGEQPNQPSCVRMFLPVISQQH